MHLEFRPGDEPGPDIQVGVAPEKITTELLALCKQFLRPASPVVHTELCEFLTEQGYHRAALGWFIDALGFTTLHRTAMAGGASR